METEESLQAYLANARSILSDFETALGWEPPALDDASDHIDCPLDKGHWLPKDRLDSHVKLCKWRKRGYSKQEIKEILDQEERTKTQNDSTIISYDPIISQIAPSVGLLRSDERLKTALSADQRLAVYEVEVSKCYSADKALPDKALYADLEAKAAEKLYQKENPENLSEVELLQKLRNMKRRRQSYRAKNVHITKRSQTEIIRGVLEVHMEELKKMWNQEQYHSAEDTEIDDWKQKSPQRDKSNDHSAKFSPQRSNSVDSKNRNYSAKLSKDYKQERRCESPPRTKHRKVEDRTIDRLVENTRNPHHRHSQERDSKLATDKCFSNIRHSKHSRSFSSDEKNRYKKKKESKKHKSRH